VKTKLTHPVFNVIQKIVSDQKLQAYVIGGFVRDLILNRPSKDIDIVVVGSGIELAEKVAKTGFGIFVLKYFRVVKYK